MSHFNKDVIQFRLIIKQPSPYWTSFDIEELHFEQEVKSAFDQSSALAQSLVNTLRQITEEQTSSRKQSPANSSSGNNASSSVGSKPKSNDFSQCSAGRIGSLLQNMWALAELYKKVKHTESIGRFEVDGGYEINLLSYN